MADLRTGTTVRCKSCNKMHDEQRVRVNYRQLDDCPECGAEYLGREPGHGIQLSEHEAGKLRRKAARYGDVAAMDWFLVEKCGFDPEDRAKDRAVSTKTVQLNVEGING